MQIDLLTRPFASVSTRSWASDYVNTRRRVIVNADVSALPIVSWERSVLIKIKTSCVGLGLYIGSPINVLETCICPRINAPVVPFATSESET